MTVTLQCSSCVTLALQRLGLRMRTCLHTLGELQALQTLLSLSTLTHPVWVYPELSFLPCTFGWYQATETDQSRCTQLGKMHPSIMQVKRANNGAGAIRLGAAVSSLTCSNIPWNHMQQPHLAHCPLHTVPWCSPQHGCVGEMPVYMWQPDLADCALVVSTTI